MGKVRSLARGRTKRKDQEAEEAIERLEKQTEQGPEAFARFVKATRRLVRTPKEQTQAKS